MNQTNETEKSYITRFDMLMESRVTRLECAILNIDKSISEIKDSIEEIRQDTRDIRKEARSDFRWLVTIIAALSGVMAHGFHWI